jgi:hypothetical protein
MSNPARDFDESRVFDRRRKANQANARDSLNACLRDKAKLQRAYGECLGSQRR